MTNQREKSPTNHDEEKAKDWTNVLLQWSGNTNHEQQGTERKVSPVHNFSFMMIYADKKSSTAALNGTLWSFSR
jgi:hypothetical protein